MLQLIFQALPRVENVKLCYRKKKGKIGYVYVIYYVS
jgi:hypothetical protein